MDKKNIRVRFAPSPTGFMHLGNVRAALVNFLFAKQKNGTFILRIEDTDANRNIDPNGQKIIEDLAWLNLNYQEGPIIGGPHEPYYQSQRAHIYKEKLNILIEKKLVYKCFCSQEELEKKRARQLILKMPPRYDRSCLNLDPETNKDDKFIWRFKLDESKEVKFYDLAHKDMHFDLKNFSDIPLTRQDGSFTFMFANFVDDLVMQITHVFRGEDHLTNTAGQIALYQAFDAEIPTFWHLPIIGNKEGKKLSKRDFGFSLTDLKDAGFLPEAICNYLAIIGGGTFVNEIMDMQELASAINFEQLSSTGMVRYDLEKLKWVNHQWIIKYDTNKLTSLVKEFLVSKYPEAGNISNQELVKLVGLVQKELITLIDISQALSFYFEEPEIKIEDLEKFNYKNYKNFFGNLILELKDKLNDPESAANFVKSQIKENNLNLKDIFSILRITLTGKPTGPSINEIFNILPQDVILKRLEYLIKI